MIRLWRRSHILVCIRIHFQPEHNPARSMSLDPMESPKTNTERMFVCIHRAQHRTPTIWARHIKRKEKKNYCQKMEKYLVQSFRSNNEFFPSLWAKKNKCGQSKPHLGHVKSQNTAHTYSHTSNTTCCNKSGNFWTIVTGWPDVRLTPYIGAVVLYRVLQRRAGVALHFSVGDSDRAKRK